ARAGGPLAQQEPHPAVARLLVPQQRGPRLVPVERYRRRREQRLDRAGLVLELGQPECRDEPERDRPSMWERESGRSLERVGERVPEVELCPLAQVERIAQADRGLERGAAAHLLRRLELPPRLSGEEPRLDDLRETVSELLL